MRMVTNVAAMMGEISDGDGKSEKNMVDRQCQLVAVWLVLQIQLRSQLFLRIGKIVVVIADPGCLVPARGVHGSADLQNKHLDL